MQKYKTSENEQSHGSFFLRVGGLGNLENLMNYSLAIIERVEKEIFFQSKKS